MILVSPSTAEENWCERAPSGVCTAVAGYHQAHPNSTIEQDIAVGKAYLFLQSLRQTPE